MPVYPMFFHLLITAEVCRQYCVVLGDRWSTLDTAMKVLKKFVVNHQHLLACCLALGIGSKTGLLMSH